MATLSDWRYTLADRLGDLLGIANRYAAVPRAPVRPCVIVTPDLDAYLVQTGPRIWTTSYRCVVLSADEQPDDATDELDAYLDALCQPDLLAPYRLDEATGPGVWALAGASYAGIGLLVQVPLCFDEVSIPDPHDTGETADG